MQGGELTNERVEWIIEVDMKLIGVCQSYSCWSSSDGI